MEAQNRNVTYLDDLPDLEELEQTRQMMTKQHQDISAIPDKYKKFIRNSSKIVPESGMGPYYHQQQEQEYFSPPVIQKQEYRENLNTPNCLDVHDHVTHCPICSKFFKFDNTVYIISIVVLSIICILLLKRVLNL